jgi:hypothetical protein
MDMKPRKQSSAAEARLLIISLSGIFLIVQLIALFDREQFGALINPVLSFFVLLLFISAACTDPKDFE